MIFTLLYNLFTSVIVVKIWAEMLDFTKKNNNFLKNRKLTVAT